MDIKDATYQVDFTVENSLRTVLGFDAKIYKRGRHESEKVVNIMSVNSILVHCDIIGTSDLNGIEAPVIYNFFPNAALADKIFSTSKNIIYVRHHFESHFTLDVLADGSMRERIGFTWRRIDNYVLHESL